MLSKSEVAVIKRSVLFRNIPDGMFDHLVRHSHKRRIDRGETLFLQGDPADHMYVVLEGHVKLIRITPTGDEIVVAVYSEGNSFGEAVALQKGSFPVTVEAATDSLLLQVDTAVVSDTLRRDPDMAVAMLGSVFSHLHELVMEIEGLKALSGAQRLATFLVSLAPVATGGCTVSLPYDKVLIAGRLGMKPESLSRSFANLRDKGVKVSRDQVAIADVGKLKSFISLERTESARLPGH